MAKKRSTGGQAEAEKSETVTENIFREYYGVREFIEKSAISKSYGFQSKKGTTFKGYPDFLRDEKDYLIVVECKADIKDHEQAEKEVRHYVSNVAKKYNVIGLAVSGQNPDELKVSHCLSIVGSKNPEDINVRNLTSLVDLQKIYLDKSLKINYEKLIAYADKLNTIFHEKFKIAVHKRPFFFAALLFSFDGITSFLNNFATEKFGIKNERTGKFEEVSFNDPKLNDSARVDFLNNLISDGVAKKFVGKLNNKFKTIDVPAKFQFIKTDNKSINSETYIKILKEFVSVFREYKTTVKYYDIIGTFYSEFLRYVQKAGGQDIVLTPDHVKTFMCELLNLQQDSVVLDICAGSGGFGAVAYGTIDRALKDGGDWSFERENNIKERQIIGVEIDEDMFALAFSNMILHGDGKSNLYKGNCFENFEVEVDENDRSIRFEDKIKALQPNKALMNPPYNDDAAPGFILRLIKLLKLAGNGIRVACVIAPSSCLRKKPDITKKILDLSRLKAIVDMNVGLFSTQKINSKTSVFIFEVGERHSGETYFYDFKSDGYRYSERKMEDIFGFDEKKVMAIKAIRDSVVIPGISYKAVLDESFENSIFVSQQRDCSISNVDFLRTMLNFATFELQEALSDK